MMRSIVCGLCALALLGAPHSGVAKGRKVPVKGAPPAQDGYFADYVVGAGGEKIPIRNYPGSVTVITRKMMNDIQATSICDALSLAPGVSTGGCR